VRDSDGNAGARLDGADDVLNAGSGSTVDDIWNSGGAVSAKVTANSIGETEGHVVAKDGDEWAIRLGAANKLEFFANFDGASDGEWQMTAANFSYDVEHHIVLTWDGTTTAPTLYLDGAAEALTETVTPTGGSSRVSDAAESLAIGNFGVSSATRTWDGVISELALYNAELTSDNASDLNAGTTTPEDYASNVLWLDGDDLDTLENEDGQTQPTAENSKYWLPKFGRFNSVGVTALGSGDESRRALGMWAAASKKGARHFDGSSQYFTVADNPTHSMGDVDFVCGGWVYLDAVSTTKVIMGKWGGGITEWELYQVDNGTLRLAVRNTANTDSKVLQATTFGTPAAGAWCFVCAWHDKTNDTVNIAVNDGSADSDVWTGGVRDAAAAFQIGAENGAVLWNGRIAGAFTAKPADAVADIINNLSTWMYNSGKGRSRAEFDALASATKTSWGFTAGNGSFYPLDENSGDAEDLVNSVDLTDTGTVRRALGPPSTERAVSIASQDAAAVSVADRKHDIQFVSCLDVGGTDLMECRISDIDSGWFEFDIVTAPGSATDATLIAVGGDDVEACAVVDITSESSPGSADHDLSVTGFDWAWQMGVRGTAPPYTAVDAILTEGFVTKNLDECAICVSSEDANTTTNTARTQRSDHFILGLDVSDPPVVEQSATSTAASGSTLTMNWDAAAAAEVHSLLVVKGLPASVVQLTSPASSGIDTEAVGRMKPVVSFLFSTSLAATTNVTTDVIYSTSDFVNPWSQTSYVSYDEDGEADSDTKYQAADNHLIQHLAADGTVDNEAEIEDAKGNDGFVLNYTTAAAAREILGLLVGAAVAHPSLRNRHQPGSLRDPGNLRLR